jgi:GH15 family glucan-1,4-alpha-glucosidase
MTSPRLWKRRSEMYNAEKHLEAVKKWRKKNPEAWAAIQKRYYENHREYFREYYKNNRKKAKEETEA